MNIQETVGTVAGQVLPAAVTIPVGGTASFAVTMVGTNGATGQFQLACSAPTAVACEFTPSSFFLPVNGSMSSMLTAQVTNVPAAGMMLRSPGDNFPMDPARDSLIESPAARNILAAWGVALLLLAALSAAFARRVKRGDCAVARIMAAITMTFSLAAAMISCGGAVNKQTAGANTAAAGSPNTPAGAASVTFPMTVVAQSGGSVVTVGTITVTVP